MIKGFLQKLELFKAPVNFRAKGQGGVSLPSSQILSLLLILICLALLAVQLAALLKYQKMTFKKSQYLLKSSEELTTGDIQFSISPAYVPSAQYNKIIQIGYTINTVENFNKKFPLHFPNPLKSCQLKDWNDYSEYFEYYDMAENTCSQESDANKIAYSESQKSYLWIFINENRSVHADDTSYYAAFNDMLLNESADNHINLYLKQTAIEPEQRDPFKEKLYSLDQMIYTKDHREAIYITLGTYIVQTETSVIPYYEDKQTIVKHYIKNVRRDTLDRGTEKKVYDGFSPLGSIRINLSNQVTKFERSRGKVDALFAYIGGLLSSLVAIFAAFIAKYNIYRYEMMISEKSFTNKQSEATGKNFGLLAYIKYQIYSRIKPYKKLDWKQCKEYNTSINQANRQLDVSQFLKRVQLIETKVTEICKQSNYQEDILANLREEPSLKIAKANRLNRQYKNTIMKHDDSKTTLQDLIKKIKSKKKQKENGSTDSSKNQKNKQNQKNKKQEGIFIKIEPQAHKTPILVRKGSSMSESEVRVQLQQFQDKQSTISQILKGFYSNFGLISKPQLRQQILNFINIAKDTQGRQYSQTQRRFAESILRIKQSKRLESVKKIPLKILFRLSPLMTKIQSQKKQKDQIKQASKNKALKEKQQNRKDKDKNMKNEKQNKDPKDKKDKKDKKGDKDKSDSKQDKEVQDEKEQEEQENKNEVQEEEEEDNDDGGDDGNNDGDDDKNDD